MTAIGQLGAQLAEQLRALQARVAELEDELEIRRLIASYGPAVDSGDSEATAELWIEAGIYDIDVVRLEGRSEIRRMVEGESHQSIIVGGAAHALGPVVVDLRGDTAVATGYSQVFRADRQEGFVVFRVAANRWELVRRDGGWAVAIRTTRLLDGRRESRDLLRGRTR